jgi:hypothetical protein
VKDEQGQPGRCSCPSPFLAEPDAAPDSIPIISRKPLSSEAPPAGCVRASRLARRGFHGSFAVVAGRCGWLAAAAVPKALPTGSQPMTFVLSAATGRVSHILPDVPDPEVADLDGDGLPELLCTIPSPEGSRLRVLKGRPPEPVRWLGSGVGQASSLSPPNYPMMDDDIEPHLSFWARQRAKSSLRLLLEMLVLLLTVYVSVRMVSAARKRRWAALIGMVLFFVAVWMAALPLPLLDQKDVNARDQLSILAFVNTFGLRWSLAWLGVLVIGVLLVMLVKRRRRIAPRQGCE